VSDPVEEAALAALGGELVVLPTDTVYGIGTRPDVPEATARLFDAKGRARDLELPVLVPTASAAREIAHLDPRAEALAARFWAGPLTLVLRRTGSSRGWELGGDPATIGVRVPRHPLALAVLARTGPLAVTSANRSGEPTPASCDGVVDVFGDVVAVYLCDESPRAAVVSTVVDLARDPPSVLRAGAVSEAEVLAAIGARPAPGGPESGV
jgi:tRNA threonylcarbamoyl adenosine modification protein (Sua5/YciO/YrdC/YwlC family)